MNRLFYKCNRFVNCTSRIFNQKSLRMHSDNVLVTEGEIRDILRKKFPQSQAIKVEDVSGGCGAMFNIYIESNDFKGLSIPKQHRTVYDTLKEQIKNIHGLHLETKIPS